MPCETHKKEENNHLSFRDILFEGNNWEEYKDNEQPASHIIEAVEKLRKCRTGELGYHYWYCEDCGFGGLSPHSCKSKLCSSCATIATKNWLAEVLPTLLDIKYFQVVFTLPPTLYPLFTANKKLLHNLFFKVASETLLLVAASLDFKPGIVIIFHPYGSEYNVHPHLHCMATAGGLTPNHQGWFPITWWPLEKTREVFKALLYKKLRKLLRAGKLFIPGGSLQAMEKQLQELYPKDWNLFIGFKEGEDRARFGLSYISRYAKRAIISDRKLVSYDGENVAFIAKTKKRIKTITLPKAEFIKRVLRHTPPKNFKPTRFYGIYANKKKQKLVPLAKKLAKAKGIKAPKKQSWRERKKKYSGKDPLLCPRCGKKLTLIEVTHNPRIPKHWQGILSLSPFDHFL